MVYNESGGGTHIEEVPADEVNKWALGENQPIEVARGVRAISKAYGGIIMDTEFCIDDKARLWFVQARPETRWNAELDEHPTTIFMRRKEVAKGAAAKAEVLLSGNGASRGAGTRTGSPMAFRKSLPPGERWISAFILVSGNRPFLSAPFVRVGEVDGGRGTSVC